jgi:signal transduction histidine kinase
MTKPTKILYIEDDPGSQQLVSRILQAEGYQVVLADNGLEGIQQAKQEQPNLILMDINMGDLDGYEVTTRLRSVEQLNEVPIIALTANVMKGSRERALVAGCDGYISKPIDVDSLSKQVAQFLGGHRETVPANQQVDHLTQYNQHVVEHLESRVLELKQANQVLQKLEKMKSDFIVLSAHELRTPLTLAYGYARLLQNSDIIENISGPTGTQVKYLSEKMFGAISRLNEVVNDILNIALIQANQMQLNLQALSIATIIQAALAELDPNQKGRNLTITIDQTIEGLPQIIGDENRLRQVFWNLLSNAIKYTPDGGSIFVKGQANAAYITLVVQDTGTGVAKEDQNNIFSRFYVAFDTDYHRSSKIDFMGGGMGIGLSIVKGIVDAHHGDIWVESSGISGEGAAFFVQLPLDPQKTDPTALK